MPKNVKVYALSTCIHCKRCKEYLDELGQPYDCVHVDMLSGEERVAAMDAVRKANPALSFPTVLVGGSTVIVGFDKAALDAALNDA